MAQQPQGIQRLNTQVPHNQRSFDDARLAQMIEPLTVRVERMRGSASTPMPLPEGENGDAQGTNWTKDDVRRLEAWIVAECGGGVYECKVTDCSQPPIVMAWRSVFDEREYPPKTPPALAGAAANAPAPTMPMPPQAPFTPGPAMSRAFPNGLPMSTPMYQQPPAYQQTQGYAPSYQMPAPPQVGSPTWATWAAERDRQKLEDELKVLRDRAAAEATRALEEKYKAELKTAEAAAEARAKEDRLALQSLQTQLASLQATIAQGAQQNKPNAEVEALKAELAAQREAAAADKRDRDLRDLINQMNANTQQQIAALTQQMDRTFTTLISQIEKQGSQTAPIMTLLDSQTRQHTDALKEIARQNAEQINKLSGFMMSPRDMIDLAQRSSSQVGEAADKSAAQWSKIIDMQQRVTENALALQPQGSGAIDLVKEGITTVKEGVEKFVNLKSLDSRLQQQAAAQAAQLNAEVFLRTKQMEHEAAHPTVHTPPPPRQEAQLGGPAVTPTTPPAPTTPEAPQAKPKKTDGWFLGRPDEQWFGVALEDVERLRAEVKIFLDNYDYNNDEPKVVDGKIIGAAPEQAAQWLWTAVNMIMQRGAHIPAVDDLLVHNKFVDFFTCLLPNAPQAYREALTGEFVELVEKATGQKPMEAGAPKAEAAPEAEEDEDEGEDESDDDDGDDKANDGKPLPPPPPAAKTKPAKQARS